MREPLEERADGESGLEARRLRVKLRISIGGGKEHDHRLAATVHRAEMRTSDDASS